MLRTRPSVLLALGLLASVLASAPASAQGTTHFGVTFPEGDQSFADAAEWEVLPQGDGNAMTDPTLAVGPPDCEGDNACFASLGREAETGLLVLTFVDNALTADGSGDDDIYFFEAGSQVGGIAEEFSAEISVDGTQWISIGEVSGGEGTGIDIDPFADASVEYRHVRLASTSSRTGPPTPGPDIDAVGAISSVPADPISSNDGADPAGDDDPAGHDFDAAGDIEWTFETSVGDHRFDMRIIRQADGWRSVITEGCGPDNPAPLQLDEYRPDEDGGRWIGTWRNVNVFREGGEVTGCSLSDFSQPAEVTTNTFSPGVHTTFGAPEEIQLLVDDQTLPQVWHWVTSSQDITDEDVLRLSYRTNRRFLEWLESDGGVANRALDSVPLFLTTSTNWPDGLAIAGAAGATQGLTLLVDPDNPARNRRLIAKMNPTELIIVGGTAAVPDAAIPDDLGLRVTRVAGDTRFTTATEISRTYFADVPPQGVEFVWIATGRNYPDALGAGANASMNSVPLLLVNGSIIPDETRAELERLRPQRIHVAGGPVAVPQSVVSELGQYGPVEVYAGDDRYATASEIAGSEPTARRAVVAPGETFEPALMAAGGAWAGNSPLLLTPGSRITDDTLAVLQQQQPEQIAIVSDEQSVDLGTRTRLDAFVNGP